MMNAIQNSIAAFQALFAGGAGGGGGGIPGSDNLIMLLDPEQEGATDNDVLTALTNSGSAATLWNPTIDQIGQANGVTFKAAILNGLGIYRGSTTTGDHFAANTTANNNDTIFGSGAANAKAWPAGLLICKRSGAVTDDWWEESLSVKMGFKKFFDDDIRAEAQITDGSNVSVKSLTYDNMPLNEWVCIFWRVAPPPAGGAGNAQLQSWANLEWTGSWTGVNPANWDGASPMSTVNYANAGTDIGQYNDGNDNSTRFMDRTTGDVAIMAAWSSEAGVALSNDEVTALGDWINSTFGLDGSEIT